MSRYEITYTLTPELQNRAMMSWAQPVLTRAQRRWRFMAKAIGFIVSVAVLVTLLQYDVITSAVMFSAGAGFYAAILLWFVTYRRSVSQLTAYANEALLRHGPVQAVFSPESVSLRTDLSTSTMDWRAIDAVLSIKGATVLRAGALVYPLPDTALPPSVTVDDFRSDLTRWMEGAR